MRHLGTLPRSGAMAVALLPAIGAASAQVAAPSATTAPAVAAPAPGDTPPEAAARTAEQGIGAGEVNAAAASPGEDEEQTIVVTGSRVAREGFSAPTPVTVVSAAQLTTAQPSTLGEAISQLPSMRPTGANTTSTGTGAGSGSTFLNLRSLGSSRTLTLLDGRRFVPATGGGSVDVNLFPSALIERVEVVTGGASAAYGSDAVAGVVNLILNKKFTGFAGNVQSGLTTYGDNRELKASAAYGTGFASDRGHLLFSAEAFDSKGIPDKGSRPWQREGWNIINNPGTGPARLVAADARLSREAAGGLVTAGPFRGTTFDSNGQVRAFNFGTLTTATNQVGGDGPQNYLSGTLTSPLRRFNGFGRAAFDLIDQITIYGEATLGYTRNLFDNGWSYASGNTPVTIRRDNAYLPEDLRARMLAQNVQTLTVGTALVEYPHTYTYGRNFTQRYVGGFDAKFGNWTGGAYYEWGRVHNIQEVPGNLNQARFYPATDAVRNAAGQIVCRTTLTNPNDGCVPFNIIGAGRASQAAVDYVFGRSRAVANTTENAAAAFAQGEPFSLWAGPVSIAIGAEYRKEKYRQTSDPLSQTLNPITGLVGVFRNANPQPQFGVFHVKEAYAETVVPLLKDSALGYSAELNGAVRLADYSTAGRVTSWKAGLTYAPIRDIRLRATRSRDVRAPNLSELFLGGTQGVTTVRDSANGNVVVGGLRTTSAGNPNLKPELGDTTTVGIVLQPSFLRGFSLSIDGYLIKIKDAIATPTNQVIIDQCTGGVASACALISRDANGGLLSLLNVPLNLAAFETRGIDFEFAYRRNLADFGSGLPGSIGIRSLATYVDRLSSTLPGASAIDRAGDTGQGNGGLPHWRVNSQLTYDIGKFSFFLQQRYIGPGNIDNTISPAVIDRYRVDDEFYYDARITVRPDTKFDIYVSVNNLFNTAPPIDPQNNNQVDVTNKALFDVVGRMVRVGVNAKF